MSLRSQALIVGAALIAGLGGLWAGHTWFGLNPPPGSLAIGAPAIEFELPTLDGGSATRAQWGGRVQVINFWAPWCAPCRREIPVLQALRKEYGPERVEILGIALDDADQVRKYASDMAIDYPILLASMSDFALMRAYGNDRDALPFTVIVDADGRLHTRKLGEYHEAELRADIEAALGP
ncbi:MAG: TlpA disulfide reductase family protein [Lysobacterales bacterium]|uniref:TlpA family protein disulfide reductase n=1 Tax=Eiseniibacteriota bacterium TaxID=2212470 RepID=A0A956M5R5_UNCEI|nr:TlpA family protein disulfide reductase [Candidatus Eisenbacteria bacterium]